MTNRVYLMAQMKNGIENDAKALSRMSYGDEVALDACPKR